VAPWARDSGERPPLPGLFDDSITIPRRRNPWLSPVRLALLGAGALLLLVAVVLLARLLVHRIPRGGEITSPTPLASPATSPILGGIGASPSLVPSATPVPDHGPQLLEPVFPAFPTGAPRLQADVHMDVLVGADGRAIRADLTPGQHVDLRLVEAARRAALESHYAPAIQNGQPVQGVKKVVVQFRP
jgi:hypothetical protein